MNLFFTSCTFGYLDRARVLAKTLKQYNSDYQFALIMIDVEPEGFQFDIKNEPFDLIYRIEDLQLDNYESWLFGHDIVEICTAVKGPFLKKFTEEDWEKIIYLDPDIAVFNTLNPILDLLDQYSIIVTPHQLEPEVEEIAIIDNEIAALNYGVYNLGFLAIRNDLVGKKLAQWWSDRLLKYCHDDLPRGLFVDQKWFDLVPAMFDNVHILRDPGYNVASWNLSNRKITIKNSCIYVNGIYPLRFYHFTKLGPVGHTMTKRYAKDNYEVFEVWNDYERMISDNSAENLPEKWWYFGKYFNGPAIDKAERVAYRNDLSLQKKFPNPYTSRVELRKALNYVESSHPIEQKSSEVLKHDKVSAGKFIEKNTRSIRRLFEKNTRSIRRFFRK